MLVGEPTITGLIDEIKRKNILLPMIQRPFVWLKDEERITKLFDSVIKRFPIGIILLYQKSKEDSTEIFGRTFLEQIDEDTEFENYDVEVKDEQILVLDGHQRLQSLYLGFIGGPFYGKNLYHNVLFFREKKDISDISFNFFKDDKKVISFVNINDNDKELYLRFVDIIEIAGKISRIPPHEKEREKKQILQDIKNLIQPIKSLPEDDYSYIYSYISDTIANSLFFRHDPSIFKCELIQGKPFGEDVLEIFVRFNQGGLPLTKSDLIFSTLKLQWKEGGEKFEDLANEVEIGRDSLLKTLIVISGLPADTKLKEVKNNIDKLKDNYNSFEGVIKRFHDKVKKLTDQYSGIYKRYNFIIPVIYYFYKNQKKLDTIQDLSMLPKILKYILIIVYNSNLRSDSHLNKIIKIIGEEKTDEFPFEKIKECLENTGTKTSIDDISLNSDPELTFSLVQRDNWKPLSYTNKLQKDHIFPKGREEELPEVLRPLVDSIFNKYVVFAGDNIRKGKTLPEEYFTGDKEKLIETYILPREYLKKEDFSKMIEWRKNKIKNLFKERLNLEIEV